MVQAPAPGVSLLDRTRDHQHLLVVDDMRVSHGRRPFGGERRVLVAMSEPYRAPYASASTRR